MQHFISPDNVNRNEHLITVRESLIDYGFYHELVHVYRMYAAYNNHGILGYAGGVMDQPEAFWHDMHIMRNLETYVKELLPYAHEQTPEDKIRQIKQTGQW